MSDTPIVDTATSADNESFQAPSRETASDQQSPTDPLKQDIAKQLTNTPDTHNALTNLADINNPSTATITQGAEIGRGGNSIAYEVTGHEDWIVLDIGGGWGSTPEMLRQSFEDRQQMKNLYDKIPPGVNAPRILKVWMENGKLYELMEKVKGVPIHDRKADFDKWKEELDTLAGAPNEHYQKLINDISQVQEVGFKIDPSKTDNFFYDPNTGFQLIDFGIQGINHYDVIPALDRPLINTYYLFTKFRNELTDDVKASIKTIMEKMSLARGDRPAHDSSEIEGVLNESPDLRHGKDQQNPVQFDDFLDIPTTPPTNSANNLPTDSEAENTVKTDEDFW